MTFFDIFKRRKTAPLARERLQILLKHERAMGNRSQLLQSLRKDVIAAVAKHVAVNPEKVGVKLERGENSASLLIDIEIVTPIGDGAQTTAIKAGLAVEGDA